MWLWWIISLLILISCIIFAWRMIVSSYDFLPVDKTLFLRFNKKKPDQFQERIRTRPYSPFKEPIQNTEDSSAFYQSQFIRFNERLKTLEDIISIERKNASATFVRPSDEEEDWKEMYYAENEAKEKLENDLDQLQQQMEQLRGGLNEKENEGWKDMYYAENEHKIKLENELEIIKEKFDDLQLKLKKSSENLLQLSLLKSEYDNSRMNLQKIEDVVNALQKRLSASAERENELENLLISEIIVREKYAMLQSKYTRLQSEASDLEQKILQQSQREVNLEIKLMGLGELESKLALCQQESWRLKGQLAGNTK